tara:strand:- start:80 stop:283 length:204 start_codon:yes stop_codon:yes gene_type:complete
MNLDENIMQTKTVGTICEIIKEAMDDMHPHSYGFKKFNDILTKRRRAMNLLGSYSITKRSVRRKENE